MSDKPLTLIDRRNALVSRHSALEDRLRDELAQPSPDSSRVQTLHRMRVRTEDHIALIARQIMVGPPAHGPEAA